jgi:hypothetical protein
MYAKRLCPLAIMSPVCQRQARCACVTVLRQQCVHICRHRWTARWSRSSWRRATPWSLIRLCSKSSLGWRRPALASSSAPTAGRRPAVASALLQRCMCCTAASAGGGSAWRSLETFSSQFGRKVCWATTMAAGMQFAASAPRLFGALVQVRCVLGLCRLAPAGMSTEGVALLWAMCKRFRTIVCTV